MYGTHPDITTRESTIGVGKHPGGCFFLLKSYDKLINMDQDKQSKIEQLKSYFAEREDVLIAYLFGSRISPKVHAHSDWDIGIYLRPKTGALEYQTSEYYDDELAIQNDCTKLLGADVDLIVMNHAPATIVFSALRGTKLVIKDYWSYSNLLLLSMFDAIDYRIVAEDYVRISLRSHSLNPIDRDRLVKILSFLENEITDLERLSVMGQKMYQENRDMQRSLDRCVENVANATIDTAKILVSSSKIHIPETYEQMILALQAVAGFEQKHAHLLSKSASMRNILAHQYLDLKFRGITIFVDKTLPSCKYLCTFLGKLLNL